MTAALPDAPAPLRAFWRKLFPTTESDRTVAGIPQVPTSEPTTRCAVVVGVRSRRKGLGPKQLKWLRQHCQPFRDMEARAKASRAGVKK